MKAKLSSLLLLAAVCGSVTALSQTESTSFVIDNNTYYLHKIAYHDLSSDNIEAGLWNQTIIADKQYIYLANHTDHTKTHLIINRFNAISGDYVDDIAIDKEEMDVYYSNGFTDDELCFYLVDCNDEDHFILFLNTSPDGIESNSKFYFYLVDKNGHIIREYMATTDSDRLNSSFFPIADFGIPHIVGNPVLGNFEIFIPAVNGSGYSQIFQYTYTNHMQSGVTSVYSRPNGIGWTTKPSVHIIDENFMIVDDLCMTPSIYSFKFDFNQCYGTINDINELGHGCNWFNYDGHRLLYVGDIYYPENDKKNGTTEFKIGLWDKDSGISRANPSVNFDNYSHLATLSFGKSTIKSSGISYTYRQFMATSDFGNNVMHLHFYVPGEFLATYQLNKYERPTDVENITNIADNHTVSYRISDKNMIFDCPVADVSVFNMTGHQIFHSTTPVKSINFANFVKGTYIIATPYKSFKILL